MRDAGQLFLTFTQERPRNFIRGVVKNPAPLRATVDAYQRNDVPADRLARDTPQLCPIARRIPVGLSLDALANLAKHGCSFNCGWIPRLGRRLAGKQAGDDRLRDNNA